jgi:hypothetical protein
MAHWSGIAFPVEKPLPFVIGRPSAGAAGIPASDPGIGFSSKCNAVGHHTVSSPLKGRGRAHPNVERRRTSIRPHRARSGPKKTRAEIGPRLNRPPVAGPELSSNSRIWWGHGVTNHADPQLPAAHLCGNPRHRRVPGSHQPCYLPDARSSRQGRPYGNLPLGDNFGRPKRPASGAPSRAP